MLLMPYAWGFSVSPMFIDMSPSGPAGRSVLTAKNSSPRAMPVTVSISEVTIGPNGKVRSIPNKNDFLIFPPKAIIKPHSKQTFRIQWRNQATLQQAKTYKVTVNQILAKDKRSTKANKGTTLNLQFGMAFASIISMKAITGIPQPVVKSSRLIRDKHGKPVLEAVISNSGNQNFLLIQADSTITVFG